MIRKIDLSGVWRFCLDPDNTGEEDGFFQSILPKRINIPGTVSAQKLSPPSIPTNYGYADPLEYVGAAWYQRDFELPRDFAKDDYTVFLTLERTRPSKVWLNGCLCGESGFLALPQEYDITEFVNVGKNHLTVLIDNSSIEGKYGNLTSPDGQTNWNGICGRVQINIHNRVMLDNIKLSPKYGDVKVTADLRGAPEEEYTAVVFSNENFMFPKISGQIKNGKLEFTYNLGKNFRYYDEFSKCYYTMRITIGGENADVYEALFGFTDFSEVDGKFYSNGREIFIRGVCEKLSLPDYGAPPCDTVYWVRRYKSAERFAGINCVVFVDTVPPEAAFDAADALGFYVALELSPSCFGETTIKTVNNYFGRHPCFIKLPNNIKRLADYPFFPDFDELGKEQVLVDYRLADELERVKAAGLYDLSERFYHASALYAKESFKLDIDRIATSSELCGYILPAAKWLKYEKAGGRLGYGDSFLVCDIARFTFFAGQKFGLSLLCCNFTGSDLDISEYGVRIFVGADIIFENTIKREHTIAHGRKSLGHFDVSVPNVETANMMRLEVFADDIVNYWDIFVFPYHDRAHAEDIFVTDDTFELLNACEEGKKILFFPDTISADFLIPESAGKALPVGTLGLLIDNRHPIFKGFPCRDYLTARWRELIGNTVSILLDTMPVTPIIRVIDNAIRNNRLGVLFEVECDGARIIVCTINLHKNKSAPALSFYNSIISYMKSDDFNPKESVTKNDLRIVFTK
jgi:hypothetical protein